MGQPFTIYPDALDGDTLGYWRFGERGGRLTPVGAGPTLTNFNNTVPGQDGYRFVKATNTYMTGTVGALGAIAKVTMEAWVRDWVSPEDIYSQICRFYKDGANRLMLQAQRDAVAADSYIGAEMKIGDVWQPVSRWTHVDVAALLDSGEPWHVAVVLDLPNTLRLFVNGVLRAEAAQSEATLPAGTYYNTLSYGSEAAGLQAVLDEYRLSKVARYTANFPITRFGEGRRALTRGPGTRAGLCAGVTG